MRSSVERAIEIVMAGAAVWVPPPPGLTRLAARRTALAGEIFSRREREVERAQALHFDRGPGRDLAPGASPLFRIAEEMVDELRSRLQGDAWRSGIVAGLLATVDARLPTAAIEYMDRPDFDEAKRVLAVSALDTWSRRCGNYALFYDALRPLLGGDGITTLIDIASGSGGFPLALAALVPKSHLVRIIATDSRPEYLAVGRSRARSAGLANIEFRVLDAARLGQHEINEGNEGGDVDVITCTQSLHHLGAGGVAVLLAEALRVARRGIFFVDLSRALSLAVATGAVSLLAGLHRSFLHDATVSARKAFVPEELALIARCVPGGDQLEAFFLPPGFVVLRSRVTA